MSEDLFFRQHGKGRHRMSASTFTRRKHAPRTGNALHRTTRNFRRQEKAAEKQRQEELARYQCKVCCCTWPETLPDSYRPCVGRVKGGGGGGNGHCHSQ